MRNFKPCWHRAGLRLLGGFAAPFVVALAPTCQAAEVPVLVPTAPIASAQPVQALDLAACRLTALSHQPAIVAAQDSLAFAEARLRALEKMRLAGLVQPDLSIRRQQATLAISIAQAGLCKAEWDAIYAVTRNYYSVLYAREQLVVADKAISNLKDLRQGIETVLAEGKRADVTTRHVEKINVLMQIVEARRDEAVQGLDRASAALREAMGIGVDCPIVLVETQLPQLDVAVNRAELLELAMARRPELAQASLAAQVTSLEVKAQQTSLALSMRTFASGSDIHAQQVPQGVSNSEYRPGAVPLEMPTLLAGCRANRVEQARALEARTAAVVDKTRNLITLETEDNYVKWRQGHDQVLKYQTALKAASTYFENVKADFGPNTKTPPDDLLNAGTTLAQTRLLSNEAQYHALIALAALERITAGGFCAGFPGAGVPHP